jgi:hypothetical protein
MIVTQKHIDKLVKSNLAALVTRTYHNDVTYAVYNNFAKNRTDWVLIGIGDVRLNNVKGK